MHPILFKIGNITAYTYGAFIALGVYAGMAWIKRHGSDVIPAKDVGNLVLALLASGIIGGRILYLLIDIDYYIKNPSAIFKIWEGGLVYYGGVALATLTLIFIVTRKRLPLLRVTDIMAPGLALAHGIGRLGCFAGGCCYGKPAHVPWAVTFTNPNSLAPIGIPLHPAQIYESAGNFLIFGYLGFIAGRMRDKQPGATTAQYIFLYGLLRFTTEFFRGDFRGPSILGLTDLQLLSLGLALTGFVWIGLIPKTRTHSA